MTKNFEIVGIATNLEDGTIETKPGKGPQKNLSMTKMSLVGNTMGKLVLSIIDYDPDMPNIMGMLFDGKQVAIRKNELYMGTNTSDQTEGRYKAYYFDIPMRFLEDVAFPKTYTIQFLLGSMAGETFVRESTSETFTLTITE